MRTVKITGKHILLLFLYSPGSELQPNEPVTGRTRLMKAMFLFKMEQLKSFKKDSPIEEITFPEFVPWKFGPFSKDVLNDLEFFINNQFIEVEYTPEETPEPEAAELDNWTEEYVLAGERSIPSMITPEEEFRLTNRGLVYTNEKLFSLLTDNQRAILAKFKGALVSASLQAILRYTYVKYPEYTTKSTIKGKIVGS